MKYIKFIFRAILSVLFIIPSIPFMWCVDSIFGIVFFFMFVELVIRTPFRWLLNDKEGLKESKNSFDLLIELLARPFLFWVRFIKGDKVLLS